MPLRMATEGAVDRQQSLGRLAAVPVRRSHDLQELRPGRNLTFQFAQELTYPLETLIHLQAPSQVACVKYLNALIRLLETPPPSVSGIRASRGRSSGIAGIRLQLRFRASLQSVASPSQPERQDTLESHP